MASRYSVGAAVTAVKTKQTHFLPTKKKLHSSVTPNLHANYGDYTKYTISIFISLYKNPYTGDSFSSAFELIIINHVIICI
jgi:hypothetical protein